MRIVVGCMFALATAPAFGAAAAPADPPKVLLHIPFDGTADIAFAANGRTKTSYLHAAFRPGVKAQGAEFGSDRLPSGLLVPCQGLLDKARGSIEFWYMPLWDPSDPRQRGALRTLITDEKAVGAMGHFWLAIERGELVFGCQGQQAASVSAPVHRWKPETWHHIVATWDGASAIRLFLDGEAAGELALAWVLPPSETLYVGADRNGGQRAGGLFDELRLYDRALTPTEAELAYIHNLNAKNAPVKAAAEPEDQPRPPRKAPRLTFHAPFENTVDAQTAAGNARPIVAEGARFAPGLVGQALVASGSLNLAYHFAKNLSKDEGAITLWACSLPERKPWRGILVSDDLFASDLQREIPGSLAMWLQCNGGSTGLFTLWPLGFQQGLGRWAERDWHHLAACWRRGEEAAFYVNGREVARAGGPHAAWGTDVPKRFFVGSLNGRTPADALIDDLRFYDGPLTREQVLRQASQFLLPVVLDLGRTLYERGQAAELAVRFYNLSPDELKTRVSLRVVNPEGTEVRRLDAPVEAAPRAWSRLRIPLSAEALAAEGLYEVTTSCEGRTACPRAYFLVVPAEEGETGALKLNHVDTIECAKQGGRDVFCETGGSRVVKTDLGAYREAGAYPDARIAYRFTVARAGVPHVAVVSYPADRVRSAEIIMTSRRNPASWDVGTGYLVKEADAIEPRLVDLPIYFWPRERENAVVLRTLFGGMPAACAKIVVREVSGGRLPAEAEPPEARGRTFGTHWDDPAVPLQFGAASTKPPAVYESFRRLADYLKFSGQNLLCYPVVWHAGTLYPAEPEEFRLGAGADRHCSDWIEYVLYLCERRGIKFLPEIVFDDSIALSNAFGAHSAEAVAGGLPTARMVLWDDTLSQGEGGGPPRYNPLHPAVRATLLDRVTEIVERYGKSPALEGVSICLGPSQSSWFASIQGGYDDQTVGEFAKEAGIELAEGKSGPTRFSERARAILGSRYDQWVSFRCRKLRQVYVDLASRVQSKQPALKLYLTVRLPDAVSPHPLLNLTAWASRGLSLDALYREGGLDVSLFKDRPANLVVRRVSFPTDDAYLGYRFASGGPNPHPGLARDLAFLSEGGGPLIGFPRAAAACSYRHFESTIGGSLPTPGFWWAEHPLRASHPAPGGRRFLEAFTHAVAEHDVASLTVGGGTLATAGREDLVREFARAFRALPPEPFTSVLGMSDPLCIRELAQPGGHFLYLVNRAGFPVDAYVGFPGKDVKLRDLGEGKELALPFAEKETLPAAPPKDFVSEHLLPEDEGPVPADPKATQQVTGSLLRVRLEPFELRSYRILTAGTSIHYAGCGIPPAASARLAQRIEAAKSLVAYSTAGAEVVAAARATLDLVARAWRKRELARVESLLDSYPLARLR